VQRFVAQTALRQFAPDFEKNAHETLHAVAEAAFVVNSILEDVGNFPLLADSGFDTDRLTEVNDRLARVAPAAWELSLLFGDPNSGPDSDAAAERQLSRIEEVLKAAREMVADYQSQVAQVRQRMEALKSRTLPWITPAAILISFVCVWVALSQVSLLSHACSWWKRAGQRG
jgi:hypothetical protein